MTPDRWCQHPRRVRLKLRNVASRQDYHSTVRFARTIATRAIERIAFFWVIAFVTAPPATGQPGPPTTPAAYRLLRYEEDYSHLCDKVRGEARKPAPGDANGAHNDLWDAVKCLPLGPERYLSMGGELRIQYERYDGLGWGAATDDRNGYLLQRYMLHGDLHAGRHVRAFLQLKSGLENGRLGGPRPVDQDVLDLHQEFVDLAAGRNQPRFTLRVGRQARYGEGRRHRATQLRRSPRHDGRRRRQRDSIRCEARTTGARHLSPSVPTRPRDF
jgi:Alginate export